MKITKTPDNDLLKKWVESVKRHRDWQQTLDKDAFFDEIFADHKKGIS